MDTELIVNLKIKENFNTFSDFYDNSKSIIYNSIVSSFQKLLKGEKKIITLIVDAKIDNLQWKTNFIYTKEDKNILKNVILTYFEEIEDYKTCIKIRELIKKLNN
jgi:hypothetical protein